jgi:hypothetical protein
MYKSRQDLKIHTSKLRDWVKNLSDDLRDPFPGHGQMKLDHVEIARLSAKWRG